MARHYNGHGDSITYSWRMTGRDTPRWLDLHPVVNEWRGPRLLVSASRFLWRHAVRSRCEFVDCDQQ